MTGGRSGDRSADHSWPGRGRAARRDHASDNGGMGAGARPAGLVLRPLSRRAVRFIRQRDRHSVCGLRAARRDRLLVLPRRHQARVWSAPAIGRRSVSLTSRSISSPSGWRCCRPIGFVGASPRADEPVPNAGRPDLDPCLHRLVELSDRTRPEQHHGLRAMTSSPRFRRFAFAYGSAFAILYVIALKLDLALFTVYPTIGVVLLGTHHSRDPVGPSMGSFLPAMYWYGWTATAAFGALIFGLGAASCPSVGHDRSGRGGCGCLPWQR